MNARLTVATGLLGSLVVLLSQFVFAYSLDDQYGIAVGRISLLSKHGPAVTLLAAAAGLALLFLLMSLAREPDAGAGASRAVGIIVAGVGVAVILVFFVVDLPDVGRTGMFDAPGAGNLDVTGSATAGLWMELVGGAVLALSGIGLAAAGPRRSSGGR